MYVRLGLLLLLAAFSQARVYNRAVFVKDQQILSNKDAETRITNGQTAEKGQFPYQIGMYLDGKSFCGGSIIDKNWILTAANCVAGFQQFTVHLGAHEITNVQEPGRIVKISNTGISHEKYNPPSLDYDVGLVKLPDPIELNERIAVIPLPPKSFNGRDFWGQAVRVSGWGKTTDASTSLSPTLQFVDLTVTTNDVCELFYREKITDRMVCALGLEGKSTCTGDSGSPLVILGNGTSKTTHFAVASFVSITGCATGTPSGYHRTYMFLDWIHDKTGIPIQA